jgi:cytochrome c2
MKHAIQAAAAISAGALATVKAAQHNTSLRDSKTDIEVVSQQNGAMADRLTLRSERTSARKLQSACTSCHVVDGSPEFQIGPDIFNDSVCIFEKQAGTADPDFTYSEALQNSGVVWTEQTLDLWLQDPSEFINGNTMYQGLADPDARQEMIRLLKSYCEEDVVVTADDASGAPAGATLVALTFFTVIVMLGMGGNR